MPRVRHTGHTSKVNEDQLLYLTHGAMFFLGTTPFDSVDEERECWMEHREDILAEWHIPGARPCAYWKFELGEPDPGVWHRSIDRLLTLGLIGESEAELIEARYRILHPGQPAELYASFLDESYVPPAWIPARQEMVQECALAARWHAYRQATAESYRSDLIGKYTRLSVVLREGA